jgi:hypothetical protein
MTSWDHTSVMAGLDPAIFSRSILMSVRYSVFLRCWLIMNVSNVYSDTWNHRY